MTPPLPQPPTDNLYKFMAIFGLIMYLFMPVLLLLRLDQVEREKLEVGLGKEALIYHTAEFQSQIDQLKKAGDAGVQQKFDDGFKALMEESLRLRQKSDFADVSLVNATHLLVILPFDLVIGSLLMVGGFLLWYYKLQRYQDRIIKNQAMQTSKEQTTV
jgi:hypothetical protein